MGEPQGTWTQSFEIRAYELDATGRLSAPTMCDYLQEAASRHAAALGFSMERLAAEGRTWVLARLMLEIESRGSFGDQLIVETWPSGAQGIFATRDFVVRDATGADAARATTAWMMVDTARRRPVRLPADVIESVPEGRPRALVDDFDRLASITESRDGPQITVGWSDLDANVHANHVRIISWALDTLPEESGNLTRLTAHFRGEAGLGDRLHVRMATFEDSAGPGYRHDLVREDGTLLAECATGWSKG